MSRKAAVSIWRIDPMGELERLGPDHRAREKKEVESLPPEVRERAAEKVWALNEKYGVGIREMREVSGNNWRSGTRINPLKGERPWN